MNPNRPLTKPVRLACLLLGVALWSGKANADTPTDQPVITSLSVAGTNLIFNATIPPDVDKAILELRATVDAAWREAALLDVPKHGGNVQFITPRPALDMAFFRLKATTLAITNSQLSTELQYVTIPPLGPTGTNAVTGTDAVFHFKGVVDGSDRILITRAGAFWEHVNWDWPAGPVRINGAQWNPRQKNYLTTTGDVAFLPETFSLATARLEVIGGRDVVALERTNDALLVYLDDTQPGAAMYEFKIHFQPATSKPATTGASPGATLKISAQIDGSDALKITAREATWQHRAYSYPGAVRLNDMPWNVRRSSVLLNEGTNTFLPAGVDLSTARIVNRKGRDVGTMWADADSLWVQFADNPNGADFYELELSFGR